MMIPKSKAFLLAPVSLSPTNFWEILPGFALTMFAKPPSSYLSRSHYSLKPTTTFRFPQAPFQEKGRYWVANEQNFRTVYLCNLRLISKVQEISRCKFYNTGNHILTCISKNTQNWCTQCRFTKNPKFSFKTTSSVAVVVRQTTCLKPQGIMWSRKNSG